MSVGVTVKVSGKKDNVENVIATLVEKYVFIRQSKMRPTGDPPGEFFCFVDLLVEQGVRKAE